MGNRPQRHRHYGRHAAAAVESRRAEGPAMLAAPSATSPVILAVLPLAESYSTSTWPIASPRFTCPWQATD